MEIDYIIKRDYSTKSFHLEKISGAIHKAMNAVGEGTEQNAQDVALSVYQTLVGRKENDVEYVPTIEEVQDIVEGLQLGDMEDLTNISNILRQQASQSSAVAGARQTQQGQVTGLTEQ